MIFRLVHGISIIRKMWKGINKIKEVRKMDKEKRISAVTEKNNSGNSESISLHSVFVDTKTKTFLFDGKPMKGMLKFDLHIEPDNNYVSITYCLDYPKGID